MEVTKVSSIILTPKQHKFCLKYVESGNASLAYREVYDCSGSSARIFTHGEIGQLSAGKQPSSQRNPRRAVIMSACHHGADENVRLG